MNAPDIVNRSFDFVGSYGNTRLSPERVDAFAVAQLEINAAKQQMELFARWCYQQHNGIWLHITPGGQIPTGTWTPWGSRGKPSAQKEKPELPKRVRLTLRAWLIHMARERCYPPWRYHADERRWYVDLRRYDTTDEALIWLRNNPILPAKWLEMRRDSATR